MATNRTNGFSIETLSQYGGPIATYKDSESIVVQHVRVNGREQIEVKLTWENQSKGTRGDVWLTNNFGRKQKFALNIDSQEALDTLIGALETARLDFNESPKASAAEVAAAPVPVKPIVGRGAAAKSKAKSRTARAS